MFFFDVDEYVYMPPKSNLKSVLDLMSDYMQLTIEQMPMSSKLCFLKDYHKTYRKDHGLSATNETWAERIELNLSFNQM
ncbi:hypothetical protein FF1_046522 [Malus domestica]